MKFVQVKGGLFISEKGFTLDINQAKIFLEGGIPVHVKTSVSICQPYCIQPEDLLWKICETFGVFMADVLRMNPTIVDPTILIPGELLYLPQRAY